MRCFARIGPCGGGERPSDLRNYGRPFEEIDEPGPDDPFVRLQRADVQSSVAAPWRQPGVDVATTRAVDDRGGDGLAVEESDGRTLAFDIEDEICEGNAPGPGEPREALCARRQTPGQSARLDRWHGTNAAKPPLSGADPTLKGGQSDDHDEAEGSGDDETHFEEDLGRRRWPITARKRIVRRFARMGPGWAKPK
jgi:hypothetical protein